MRHVKRIVPFLAVFVVLASGLTWADQKAPSAEQIQSIHRLKAEGEKVAAIARATGLSRPTVYSVLKTATT